MIRWLVIGSAAILGLALGAGVAWLTRPEPPSALFETPAPGAEVGDIRPDFEHASLDGQYVRASDFDGRVVLVNFWATWCAPCVREMPLLQAAAEEHGENLTVVGIAVDEPGGVRAFVEELGISYPILVGTSDVMETNRAWGNTAGALPYTVLVDRDGVIRWQHLGEVTADMLTAKIDDWL